MTAASETGDESDEADEALLTAAKLDEGAALDDAVAAAAVVGADAGPVTARVMRKIATIASTPPASAAHPISLVLAFVLRLAT